MNEMICLSRSILGRCVKYKIEKYTRDIKNIDIGMNEIERLQEKIDNCIKQNNIKTVLAFDGEYIGEAYFEQLIEKEYTKDNNKYKKVCGNQVKKCESDCKIKEIKIGILENKIKYKMKKYNRDLLVIKKIQEYYKKYEKNTEEICIKFGQDRNENLIVMCFNIDSFIQNTSKFETIYVFSGEEEDMLNKFTALHLAVKKYDICLNGTGKEENLKKKGRYAHICDFRSENQRYGQGTFILKNLVELLKQVNFKILQVESAVSEKYIRKKLIKAITGEVVPGNIPKEKLIKFYNKNGFETLGKRFSNGEYVENRVLFQKIE